METYMVLGPKRSVFNLHGLSYPVGRGSMFPREDHPVEIEMHRFNAEGDEDAWRQVRENYPELANSCALFKMVV